MFTEYKQGYASVVMDHFDFVARHGLDPYTDKNKPLIVFGVYRKEDLKVVENHKGKVLIRWCGVDSKEVTERSAKVLRRPNIIHVSPHPKVIEHLSRFGIRCDEWHLRTGLAKARPQVLGNKIYTYTPKNHKKYGSHIVDRLKTPYEIVRTTHWEMPIDKWKAGGCEKYYSQAFVGLALSDYAAGLGSINEMGIRGIPVITNVVTMPHTIPWKTEGDIVEAIAKAAEHIGKWSYILAEEVEQYLNNTRSCIL